MKILRRLFSQKTLTIFAGIGIIALISAPFWIQLNSLTGGLSDAEQQLQLTVDQNSLSLSQIIFDPFFFLHSLLLLGIQAISFPNLDHVRLASAVMGTIGVIGFYYIIKSWYSPRLAILATLLFGASAWTLNIARYASPESSYLIIPALLAAWLWVIDSQYKPIAIYTALILGIFTLYIPGMVWFLLPALYWQRRVIAQALFRLNPTLITGLCAVILVGIMPLVVSTVFPPEGSTHISNILTFFGLPNTIPSLSLVWQNLSGSFLHIFVRSPEGSLLGVGTLPLLDIFTSAMAIIGLWVMATSRKLDRTKMVPLLLLGGTLLLSIGGPIYISLLLPILFLLAAEGIGYMLNQWLTVFPRNPFARQLGIGLIVIAVLVTSFFQLTSYFVAWPHTDAAVQAFHQEDKN